MPKPSATQKMMRKNQLFDNLPSDLQSKIMDFNKRRRGRPAATIAMKQMSKEKKVARERGIARIKKATKEKDLDRFLELLDNMEKNELLGKRAVDAAMERFVTQNKDVMEERKEMKLDEAAEDLVGDVLSQAQKEVRIEEGAPVKLWRNVVDEFSKQIPVDEQIRTSQRVINQKNGYKLPESFVFDRDKPPQKRKPKRSQLSEHFSSYTKSEPDSESKPKPKKPKPPEPLFKVIPAQYKKQIIDVVKLKFNGAVDDSEIEFAWDNIISSETKDLIADDIDLARGDGEILSRSRDLDKMVVGINEARRTEKMVPDYLEGNEDMSKEEKQREFHKLLIQARLKTIEEKAEQKAKNNFGMNDAMGGGINNGMPLKSIKGNDYKTPAIYEDYEFLLDDKITENAMAREMFRGIDVNSLIDKGNEGEIAAYFQMLNEKSNEQDDSEINNALDNIEILSGGIMDSLFAAQDLISARPPLNRGWQPDIPDDRQFAPAGLERGRNAQALDEVDEDAIRRQDRIDGVSTIALGLGALNSAYRGIFGKSDIVESSKRNISEDINQNVKLIGKAGLYGNDKSLGRDDEMYEGVTFTQRLSGFNDFANHRDINSNLGIRDPNMLQENKEAEMDNKIAKAIGFNAGKGVAGAALPQLREQEFGYKQANRSTKHDGYAFIRAGKRRDILLATEFDP